MRMHDSIWPPSGSPAQLSHALQLPMADSIILATARDQRARWHTMDSEFQGIADVEWLGSS